MIQWFDFEQGAPPEPKYGMPAGQIWPKGEDVPHLVPAVDGDTLDNHVLVVLVMANQRTLKIITDADPLKGFKFGCRVTVVFNKTLRDSLKVLWGSDPGEKMIGLAETWVGIISEQEDDNPF